MSEILRTEATMSPPQTDIDLLWFVKRTIMAIVILCVSISGIAWRLHASIDSSAEALAAQAGAVGQSSTLTNSISQR